MKAKSFLTILSVFLVLLLCSSVALGQNLVSIDGITNLTHDSVLSGGVGHTVTIRFNLSGAQAGRNYLAANAFKIFSPDGADWEYVQGTALSGFSSIGWDQTYVNHFNKAGGSGIYGLPAVSGGGNSSGNDTVVVQLAGVNGGPGPGLTQGYNQSVLFIEFGSRRADNGLHICIDTCSNVSGGWEWAHADGLIEPDWSGSACWVVGCCAGKVGDVNASGEDEPTIGDVSALIDFLFLDGPPLDCLEESDINQSGTFVNPPLDTDDLTIGDVSFLIDYLFVNYTPIPDCP